MAAIHITCNMHLGKHPLVVALIAIRLLSVSPDALAALVTSSGSNGRSIALIVENQHTGTTSWRITRPASQELAGYASATSIDRGKAVTLFVSTIASRYRIDIYRMGWYQGYGARLVKTVTGLSGIRQRPCAIERRNMVRCVWKPSYVLSIPSSWPGGVYLAKLTTTPSQVRVGYQRSIPGWQSYIIFVVRDDASHSALLFQTSVTTYQAYNTWYGLSLYDGPTGKGTVDFQHRAYAVSFDRPYTRGDGAGDFLYWEYPMVRWLEMNGYDVTYDTDIDTDASADLLLHHKALLIVGHDEYWSHGMRTNIERALAQGVSLGFFGGNIGYWQVRFEASQRVMVCYKDAKLDPFYGHANSQLTIQWRSRLVGRPEQTLEGQMWESWYRPPTAFALRLINTTMSPFAGTGLHDGDTIPGIVGYEYDRVFPDALRPKGLLILASSPVINVLGKRSVSNVTLYTAPSGARVFSAGTIEWSWGLDDDDIEGGVSYRTWSSHHVASSALRRLTANIVNAFLENRLQV